MIKPNKLSKGDTIGILAPAYTLEKKYIQSALDNLNRKGFKIKIAGNTFKNTFEYAASPQERADDFNMMIADDDVKMLLFEGGEVCNEILPLLDYSLIRKKTKIISSYSDSTTIMNAITSLSGLVTYYGQSITTFSEITDYNYKCFESAFMNEKTPIYHSNSKWSIINGGKCSGRLTGGYLPNFAIMLNGKYLKHDKNQKYVLFLEDHINFSSPAVVSKYLSHIGQSGLMDNVTGLLFGHYSEEAYPVLIDILHRFSSEYNIPAVKLDDYGHGNNHSILPVGLDVHIDTSDCSLIFSEGFVV